jgi:hypothetical protein
MNFHSNSPQSLSRRSAELQTPTHTHLTFAAVCLWMNMSSYFAPFCLYELSSATSFCSVMISEEKIYIDFTLSRGHPAKGPLLTHDPQRYKHGRQRMYKRNNQACLRNHWWGGKASITNSVRALARFALVIQNAMGIRHIVICGLSCSTILFLIISLTARFSEEKLLNKKCVFWFYLQRLSETFLTLNRKQRNTMCVHKSSSHIPIIPVRFL